MAEAEIFHTSTSLLERNQQQNIPSWLQVLSLPCAHPVVQEHPQMP